MVVGFTKTSPSDMTGNSSGKPPAARTPRFTDSATRRRWTLQFASSLQELQIPISGRPRKDSSEKPSDFSQERCRKPSRSERSNHLRLRRPSPPLSGTLRKVDIEPPPSRDRVAGLARGTLEARLGQVGSDVGLGHEDERELGVGRRDEALGELGQKELERRHEALEVGLLVEREVQLSLLDQLQGRRQDAVPAHAHPLGRQAVLHHGPPDSLARRQLQREQPPHLLVG